uniref:Caffeoyl-CoA O-methyltransferase n=1 Tax=Rhabditophanes sp. KR3021 TaxID=114890 RepID=A0AC35UHZ9_9BILA
MPLIPPGVNAGDKPISSVVAKSYSERADPIAKYCAEHTAKPTELEQNIAHSTLANHKMGRMLGAPEVLQCGKNFIKLIKAKRCLDIGTFTGASAVAWATALPDDGKVISFDVSHDALEQIGMPQINNAHGIAKKIDFVKGSALDGLDRLIANGESGTYDFAFVDADKVNYINYHDRCMKLIRSGGVIIYDNALWGGSVINPHANDESTSAIKALNEIVFQDPKCESMLLNSGDGIHVCFVN